MNVSRRDKRIRVVSQPWELINWGSVCYLHRGKVPRTHSELIGVDDGTATGEIEVIARHTRNLRLTSLSV